jgi:hypothetical protein
MVNYGLYSSTNDNSTDIRIELLFKKYIQGVPTSYPKSLAEGGSARPFVTNNQIYSQPIPSSTAGLTLTSTVNGKQTLVDFPYIAKYTQLNLVDITSSKNLAFAHNADQSISYTRNAIPSNYDLQGSYGIKVFDSRGFEYDGNYPWVFDVDSGILLFLNAASPPNTPPKITFWRYEGTTGLGSFGLSDASLNYRLFVGGDVSLNSRLTVYSDVSFNNRLFVGGNITTNGLMTANSFNATSDYRIKNIIKILDKTYTVDDLLPVHYLNKLSLKEDIGLIAHELQEHFPFLVNGEKDGENYQNVNYIGLIGLLINEIKNIKKDVKTLKNEMIELKQQNL